MLRLQSSSKHKSLLPCNFGVKPLCSTQLILLASRGFAGGDEITRPKVYSNVFNKWESRDKKRVYYSLFPYDYNEPWPFPPVYNPNGSDRNVDPVWGLNGEAPPCSVTGKPRRALGHYPWLGRPIVPLNDYYRWVHDDQYAPYPLFRPGIIDKDSGFYSSWLILILGTVGLYWLIDEYYRKEVSFAHQRDMLWYKEVIMPPFWTFSPIASTRFGNPSAPIVMFPDTHAPARFFPTRGQFVFIKGGDEDTYGHVDYFTFDWNTDGYIHPSLRKKPKDAHHHHGDHEHKAEHHDSSSHAHANAHAHQKTHSH